jgi:hypothetical protein
MLATVSLQRFADRLIYPSFQFVIPDADAYAVTGPLRTLWKAGHSHVSRVFSNAASAEAKKHVNGFKKSLMDQCSSIDEFSDLGRLGIDDKRGVAFSLLSSNKLVLALPLSDRDRFLPFLLKFLPPRLVLTAEIPSAPANEDSSAHPDDADEDATPQKRVTEIKIDASNTRGVSTCDGGTIKPFRLEPGTAVALEQDADAVGFDVIFGDPTAELRVQCTAVLSDGTNAPCVCRLNGEDCSSEGRRFLQRLAEKLRKGQLVQLASDKAVCIVDETLLLVQGPTTDFRELAEAAANVDGNLRFFRGDDTLRTTLARLSEIEQDGAGSIVGAVSAPYLPFAGRMHFALAVGQQDLRGRLLVPWQMLQSRLLEQVAAPAPQRPTASRIPLSPDAQVQVNDPSLGYYLRFLDGYSDWSQVYLKKLGSFVGFVRELMKFEDVGVVRLAARGVREGVPDVVMSIEMERETAENLIEVQRSRMREVRDREVLWGAAQKYIQEHPDETPTDLDDLEPYLDGESFAGRYTVASNVKWDKPSSIRTAFEAVPDSGDTVFPDSQYMTVREEFSLLYVSPPITSNDIAYRVIVKGEDSTVAALRTGRYRLVAHIDERARRLLLATGAEGLVDLLKSERSSPTIELKGSRSDKITLIGDPKYLINQGLLYPDSEVNAFVTRYLLDLDQYRSIDAWLVPMPSQRVLSATIVLSHER